MNNWSNEDITLLKEIYPKFGMVECRKQFPYRTRNSIKSKLTSLCLRRPTSQNHRYERSNFEVIVAESFTYSEVARRLGLSNNCGNRNTIGLYIKEYGIDISHFDGGKRGRSLVKGRKNHTIEEILVVDSNYLHTTNLKEKLYILGLKTRICELCGQTEDWKGKHMSLILDHKNGIKTDNRLDNLRIVCPNCNATLDTHGGKNIKDTNTQGRLEMVPSERS